MSANLSNRKSNLDMRQSFVRVHAALYFDLNDSPYCNQIEYLQILVWTHNDYIASVSQ